MSCPNSTNREIDLQTNIRNVATSLQLGQLSIRPCEQSPLEGPQIACGNLRQMPRTQRRPKDEPTMDNTKAAPKICPVRPGTIPGHKKKVRRIPTLPTMSTTTSRLGCECRHRRWRREICDIFFGPQAEFGPGPSRRQRARTCVPRGGLWGHRRDARHRGEAQVLSPRPRTPCGHCRGPRAWRLRW